MEQRDHSLDTLLLLDGEAFVVEAKGACWVRFVVKQVEPTPARPHGLRYALTLHDATGRRLLGFDNAHAIQELSGPGSRTRIEFDHKHSGGRVRFYEYRDAVTLLEDFWSAVEEALHQRSFT